MNGRRAALYAFYDPDGVVDTYNLRLLQEMKRHCEAVYVVVNGALTAAGEAALRAAADDVYIRENTGYDIMAYREGMAHIGYDTVCAYGEFILMNNTVLGPVYSFAEMFARMDARDDLAFWGMTAHSGSDEDITGCCPYGYTPEHLQSYFLCFRSPLLGADIFRAYWEGLPPIHSYKEAIGRCEAYITKHFADAGFLWDAYIDRAAIYPYSDNAVICCPRRLVEQLRMPVFKRRLFFQDHDYNVTFTYGNAAVELYDFLAARTDFDMELLLENLIRTCHMSDLVKTLQWTYAANTRVFPDTAMRAAIRRRRILQVIHIYEVDLTEQIAGYAKNLPDFIDICITTNTEAKKAVIERAFAPLPNRTQVRVIPNRGRDVSSLLVGVADLLPQYDYVCYIHDKKTSYLKPETVGVGFSYRCFENTLASPAFVENVLALFEGNARLGLLAPAGPNHGDFFSHIGNEWSGNYEAVRALADRLGLAVPMHPDKEPIAPYGSYFWFRREALAPLLDAGWTYEDFPKEPVPVDHSLLHAVERVYPFAAQHAGYYAGFLFSDSYMSLELINLFTYARRYSHLFASHGFVNYYYKVRDTAELYWQENDDLHLRLEEGLLRAEALEKGIGRAGYSFRAYLRTKGARLHGRLAGIKRRLTGTKDGKGKTP